MGSLARLAFFKNARERGGVDQLEDEQSKLLDLFYAGGVSERVMQRQTERIEQEEAALTRLLKTTEFDLEELRAALDDALLLATAPMETYLTASDTIRRLDRWTIATAAA